MKRIICTLFIIVSFCFYAHSQVNGYTWWFNDATPPFRALRTSSLLPAYKLTTLGSGNIITGISDSSWNVLCGSDNMQVASFTKPFGFRFSNDSSHTIGNDYTIEIVFKSNAAESAAYDRLIGFYGLGENYGSEYGIYIDPLGHILHYTDELGESYGSISDPFVFQKNTWYHLVIERNDADDSVHVYSNGGLVTTFYDPAAYLAPHSANGNAISFFKDNGDTTEEMSGRVAKISIYDTCFNKSEIEALYANKCYVPASYGSKTYWSLNGNEGTDSTHFIGTLSAQPLIFKTNSVEAMRLDSAGNLGLGARPRVGYKLSVAGNLLAEKITVKALSNWPDYVFDKKYPLLPLKELEGFILKNKHLPGIPAANEIHVNGIDIGEQQTILLQKIEELTLYIIEQNKKLEAQKKRIMELEQITKGRKL